MEKIPRVIQSQTGDRVMCFIATYVEPIIQLEMEFDQPLDAERLSQAVDLTLDAEPVLGCRFVVHVKKPYWERLESDQRKSFFRADNESDYEAFKSASIDYQQEPQIKACLWSSSEGDKLLLKVSHMASDAGGTKEIAARVSSIYNRLEHDARFRPEPNLKGSRSFWQILRRIPWYAFPRIYLNYLIENWTNFVPLPTHSISFANGPVNSPIFVQHVFEADQVSALANYGRLRNATLNDLMVAAFFRAMASAGNWDGKKQLRLATTADLRRYLPLKRAEGICNISGFEFINLGTDLGDNFESTLAKISEKMRRRKANWIGLNGMVGAAPLLRFTPFDFQIKLMPRIIRYCTDKGHRLIALTNMGPISPKDVTFGIKPKQACLLTPPIFPPQFGAGLTGYEGTLTLSFGIYPPTFDKNSLERFINTINSELPL